MTPTPHGGRKARSSPAAKPAAPHVSSGDVAPFPKLAQPALRALTAAGYSQLNQLTQVSETTLAKLHGIGPNALRTLRKTLAERGWTFAGESGSSTAPASKPSGELKVKTTAKQASSQAARPTGKPASGRDHDEYIAQFSPKIQKVLEKVRSTIHQAAPGAEEVISYQMPAFRLKRILIYFAAWQDHLGLYPPVRGNPELEAAAAPYAGPKGNLQCPWDQPIPYDLIRRIVSWRAGQNQAKPAAKLQKKK